MEFDVRDTPLFKDVRALCERLREPGTGRLSEVSEVCVSPDGTRALFSGSMLDALEGAPASRICQVDLGTGAVQVLTFGPHTDRLPKFSLSGQIAFLSDRHRRGDYQLYFLDPYTGGARAAPRVEGWIEYFHWSPDGKRLLLGVAGHGADIAGGQGAIATKPIESERPSWMPIVQTGDESFRWRRAWIYEVATDAVRAVSSPGCNVWESAWCGNTAIVAVVSPGPSEGLWYSARLHSIDIRSGESRELYVPQEQLGWPAGSPSGHHVAVVDAFCSDRWVVAGDLKLVDAASGSVRHVSCNDIDVTYTEWRSEDVLLVAGHRSSETAIGLVHIPSGSFKELWQSADITTAGRYATVAGFGVAGECVLAAEGFTRAPELAMIRDGQYRTIRSFGSGYARETAAIAKVESLEWLAADGLKVQGWLLRPQGTSPHPLVMNLHGGPVWHWRPQWLGRPRSLVVLALLQRGYAVFFPNPRGSAGRGQQFARMVKGDLNGADSLDLLAGIDRLCENGVADRQRIGVTGISYGGCLSSWLITQDARFAAAVPVCPHTNQVTEHLISNIPHFVALFLQDSYTNPTGKYFQRSSINFVHRVRTPTLNICGALDRCTPPEEAVQFHNALLEQGVKSVLITYPEEGHGIQKFPAAIDYTARVVSWFEQHMPATSDPGG